MARISKDMEAMLVAKIRAILTYNPKTTGMDIKRQLAEKGLNYDKDYIYKLLHKIERERMLRLNKYVLNQKIAEFEDLARENVKRLITIVSDDNTPPSAKVMALKEIRESYSELFDKMFEAGIFEKQLGTLKIGSLMDYMKAYYEAGSDNTFKENKKLEGKSD